jgi:protein-tyrosine phosphatase
MSEILVQHALEYYAADIAIAPHRLYVGQCPTNKHVTPHTHKLYDLIDLGVTTVISLMEEDELYDFSRYRHLVLNTLDTYTVPACVLSVPIHRGTAPTIYLMQNLLSHLDNALSQSHVYIHSWTGNGRAAMALGCWLVRHGVRPNIALRYIDYWRNQHSSDFNQTNAPESLAQLQFVRNWRKHA